MCARYTQIKDLRAVLDLVQARGVLPAWVPRHHIAPRQEAPVIVRVAEAAELKVMRWGLVPPRAEDAKIGARLINARAETIEKKPSFRDAFARRRCLVPADGFYEWESAPEVKRPWRYTLRGDEPFCFAGLWALWQPRPPAQAELFPPPGPARGPLETFTIITTAANELVRPAHDRMPVILAGAALRSWLEPAATADALQELLRPHPAGAMQRLPAPPQAGTAFPQQDQPQQQLL